MFLKIFMDKLKEKKNIFIIKLDWEPSAAKANKS